MNYDRSILERIKENPISANVSYDEYIVSIVKELNIIMSEFALQEKPNITNFSVQNNIHNWIKKLTLFIGRKETRIKDIRISQDKSRVVDHKMCLIMKAQLKKCNTPISLPLNFESRS